MITQSSLKNIYKERALLLFNHFENNMQVLVGGLKQLDIIGTIKNVAEKLLEEFPSYRRAGLMSVQVICVKMLV